MHPSVRNAVHVTVVRARIAGLLAVFLFACATARAAPAWAPPPAPPATPIESVRVRIVAHGQDLLRDGDGRPVHQFHVHGWRAVQDAATGLWQADTGIERDLTVDVDGDGNADDDVAVFHPFSLSRPWSPEAPWYDALAGSPRFYGGAAIFQANRREAGFSEDGVNHEHDGPMYLPRDNWALFHETYEINAPYRLAGVWIWQKEDFLNGGADCPVSFDDQTALALYLQRYFMCVDGVRFLAREGGQFYVSEAVFRGAGQVPGSGNGKQHVLRPAEARWAPYTPKPPHDLWFDAAAARFEPRAFQDVTAVGFYAFKDRFIPSYFGLKWYAFAADGLVRRPSRPSESIAMAAAGGAGGVPGFWMSTSEVPYELWKRVFRRARSNTFVRDPRGYVFHRDGDMGAMDADDEPHSAEEPVTDITLLDAAAWCNALSEHEGRTPCYYEEASFATVFRDVLRSPVYGPPRDPPALQVRWDADGYRLPTLSEWIAAGVPEGAFWRLVWTPGGTTTVSGGARQSPSFLAFRIVRREPGLPAPPSADAPAALPRWEVPAVWRPGDTPVPKGTLQGAEVPDLGIWVAAQETSYALWKRVRDWALAHGYRFDADGDMGSMDYWGMADGWGASRPHTPSEPVTDLTLYDAALWCNALSEIEGRTPVYYADPACTQVYREAFVYRPLMQLFFETEADQEAGRLPRDRMLAVGALGVRPGADGYRLPTSAEHGRLAARAGSATDVLERAWLFDNSGGTTHAVGSKPAGPSGLHDLEGNVSELCTGDSPAWDLVSGVGVLPRCGGSFIDLAAGLRSTMPPPRTPAGWGYPDVGFRVVRTLAARPDAALPPAGARPGDTPPAPAATTGGTGLRPIAASPAGIDLLRGRVARGSLLRDGVLDGAGPRGLSELAWKFQTGGPVKSSPVVVDGCVYFGSNDGHVYALVAETGQERWKLKTGGKVTGAAAVVDGAVFIPSEEGALYAIDAATGQTRWRAPLEGGQPCGAPAVVAGTVIVGPGTRGGSEVAVMSARPLAGFAVGTGARVWEAQGGPQGYAAVCTDGTRVFAGENGHFFAAYELSGGKRIWNCIPGHQDRQFGSMARAGDAVYFAGSMAGSVNAHNAATGQRLWMATTHPGQLIINNGGEPGYEILGSPAVAYGRVYVGCNDGRLHTFRQDDGERGWTFATGGPVQSSPTVAGGVVYFGSHDAHLYALDAQTGRELGRFRTGGRIVSAPWPSGGAVYVGSDDGCLYAIRDGPR